MALRIVPDPPCFDELPEVLTIEEAAKVLRIGRGPAYALARQWLDSGGRQGPSRGALGAKPASPQGRLVAAPRRERRGQRARSVSASSGTEGPARQGAAGLLVAPESRQARRRLGTTAWAVLEDVALDAHIDDRARLVAFTNVRRIARHLGISKDTAARALVRLADAGLVERQHRRDETGAFTASVYVVRLDHGVGLVHVEVDPRPTTPCPDAADTADLVERAVQDSRASAARPGRSLSRRSSRRAVRADQGGLFAAEVLGDYGR